MYIGLNSWEAGAVFVFFIAKIEIAISYKWLEKELDVIMAAVCGSLVDCFWCCI